ncbi:MAG: hypothetical protein K8R59_13730 [Thermoanaerobaculales bacterium]|nr:hypothetical protein [Thermoanaerobaculales bacterium]
MQRIIFLVLLLYVAWRVLAAWGRRTVRDGAGAEDFSRYSPRSRDRRRKNSQTADVGELTACSRCGTYVPSDRLVSDRDGRRRYCSDCETEVRETSSASGNP